jgi:hypothetical protein
MAIVWAVKTGNLSDPNVWNTGDLPDVIDVVVANGFTVTIDRDIEVVELRTLLVPATGTVSGGTFNFASGISEFTVIANLQTGTTTVLSLNRPNVTYNIIGTIRSGVTASIPAVYATGVNGSNITVNVVGDIITSTGQAGSGLAFYSSSNVNLNYTGNITTVVAIQNVGIYFNTVLGGTIIITGNLLPSASCGHYSYSQACFGVVSSTLDITINGNVYGGGAYSRGLIVGGSGAGNEVYLNGIAYNGFYDANYQACGYAVYIIGTHTSNVRVPLVQARNTYNGVALQNVNSSSKIIVDVVLTNSAGVNPIGAGVYYNNDSTISSCQGVREDGTVFTFDGDYTSKIPAEEDVRYLTTYYDGLMVGSLRVATPSQVLKDVPTDNTVGTAVITKEALFGEDADEILTGLVESIQKIDEFHRIHGLKAGSPLEVTDNSRKCGDIEQTIEDDGETTTVTRV